MSATARRNSRTRAKGYAPWSPRPETVKLLDRVSGILDEYHNQLPMTARQVFYRLVGAHGYPKDERAYERLCNALNRARRAGIIRFESLRDDGASALGHDHHAGMDSFYGYVNRLGRSYKRDKLANQEIGMRVYCEAAGMMPQLARVCSPYSVPVYSCSGFDSLTAKYQLALACSETFTYKGRPTVILHLGDLDPSGVSIYESMREDVLAFIDKDIPLKPPEEVALFERAALAEHHVKEFDLPTAPPKKSDGRSGRWVGETCQLEALPPDTLAAVLEQKIRAWLDHDIYCEDLEVEEQERRQITRALPSP